MIRQNLFEKKYSLLAPYILDESVRKNLLANDDFMRKYDANYSMIKVFLYEIGKRFDTETINKIVSETIFKFSSPVLISFITAYLNSDEATKNNSNVVFHYKKVLHQGTDVIKYVEENGIVTNRTFKEIPQKIMDNRFESLERGQVYGNVTLKDLYPTMSPLEKQSLIEFLENDSFKYINELFGGYFRFNKLFKLIKFSGIDTEIINRDNYNKLGPDKLRVLILTIFTLLGDINIKSDVEVIKEMLRTGRIDLLDILLKEDMVVYAHYLNPNYIAELSEDEMVDRINMSKIILEKSAA